MRPIHGLRSGYRRLQSQTPQVWGVYITIIILSSLHLFGLFVEMTSSVSLTSIFGVSSRAITFGQVYRLLTAIFFHLGLLHLLMNMFVLYMLGSVVEQLAGPLRFFAVFLTAGLTGTAFSALFNAPNVVSVGASGAIMGYLGYILASKMLDPRSVPQAISQWAMSILLINVFWNVASPRGLDVWGHVGGFVGGALAVGFLGLPAWRTGLRLGWARLWLLRVVSVLLVAGVIYAPLASLPADLSALTAVGLAPQQIRMQWERQQLGSPGSLGRWAWEPHSYAQIVTPSAVYQAFQDYVEDSQLPAEEVQEQWQRWQELAQTHQLVLVHLYVSEFSPELTDLREPSVGMGRAFVETSAGLVADADEIHVFPVQVRETPYYAINILAFPQMVNDRPLVSDATFWVKLEIWTGRGDLSVQFDL